MKIHNSIKKCVKKCNGVGSSQAKPGLFYWTKKGKQIANIQFCMFILEC